MITKITQAWQFTFGDEQDRLKAVSLPKDQMLLAEILSEGLPAEHPERRVSYICAAPDVDVIVRTGKGAWTFSERYGARVPGGIGGRSGAILPDDWREEAFAMIDGVHFVDWLSPEEYAANDVLLSGTACLGPFEAQLDAEHHFVTSASVGYGSGRQGTLRMTRHRLMDNNAELLRRTDVSAHVLDAFLAS